MIINNTSITNCQLLYSYVYNKHTLKINKRLVNVNRIRVIVPGKQWQPQ